MSTMKDIGLSYARNAGADLSAALYKIVKVDTDGDIVLAGAGDVPFGVVIEEAAQNEPVTVLYGGQGKVLLGGTVTAGELIAANSSGLGVAQGSSPAAAGVLGIALQSGVSGEIIEFAFRAGQ